MKISVFDSTASTALENYNKSEYRNPYGPKPGESDLAAYKNSLLSASVMVKTDHAIFCVIREEIQAYFAGDKTLDEVNPVRSSRGLSVLFNWNLIKQVELFLSVSAELNEEGAEFESVLVIVAA